ncbi:hypothetical protein HY612_02410 [Candidatus Roizmanbacteria bacterium]|nr:hypothetical protein [Candidatus Roizmanbacteria bacterium]
MRDESGWRLEWSVVGLSADSSNLALIKNTKLLVADPRLRLGFEVTSDFLGQFLISEIDLHKKKLLESYYCYTSNVVGDMLGSMMRIRNISFLWSLGIYLDIVGNLLYRGFKW